MAIRLLVNSAVTLRNSKGDLTAASLWANSNPDLIFAIGGAVARQLKPLTTTIPIIAISNDPIAGKLVTNLARPDANITGASVDAGLELFGKRLGVFREEVRKLTNVRVLISSSGLSFWETIKTRLEEDAARLGISVSFLVPEAEDQVSYERAFDLIVADRANGLMVSEGSENTTNRKLIVDLAARHGLPAIYPYRDYVEVGGLLSYGVNLADVFRRMAAMTADALSGKKPAEIPFYQQTKLELVLNRKTAISLRLEFPTSLLAIADEVIE
jgi:putative tryptophan/tyrosine transport system substrate-binding protein